MAFYLPRPDRLYQILRFRRQPSEIDVYMARTILAEYGLELLGEPRPSSGPGRSHSLTLSTSQGKRLLKRYKHTVIVPTIIHEHSILTYLAQVGFPAPRLVGTLTGDTCVRQGDRNYALFEFIEGGFQYHNCLLLPGQTRQFISIAGQTLATLHTWLEKLDPQGHNPHGFRSRTESWWRGLDWYADLLVKSKAEAARQPVHDGRNLPDELLKWTDYLGESLYQLGDRLEKTALPRVIIHGDYGPYNLLFKPDKTATVLDFEIARLDWRATELVDSLPRFCYNRWGFDLDKMRCFLAAYRACSAVADDEWQLLPDIWTFLNVRRCIVNGYQYSTTQDAQRLTQARWNLKLIEWMAENRSVFLSHLGA